MDTDSSLYCLNYQVRFVADGLEMDLLRLGQTGNPLISVIGGLDWICSDIGPASPLPYTADLVRRDEDERRETDIAAYAYYSQTFYEAKRQQQGGVISFTREEAFLVSTNLVCHMIGRDLSLRAGFH